MESKKDKIPPGEAPKKECKFVRKLLNLVENQSNNQTVSWSIDGDSFVIKDISTFTSQILPKYYKHNNLSNFIRLLNMYNFKKVRKTRKNVNQLAFQNIWFSRSRLDLLCHIARKKYLKVKVASIKKSSLKQYDNCSIISNHSCEEDRTSFDLNSNLKNKMSDLRKKLISKSTLNSELLVVSKSSKHCYDVATTYQVNLEALLKHLNLATNIDLKDEDSFYEKLSTFKLVLSEKDFDLRGSLNKAISKANDDNLSQLSNKKIATCIDQLSSKLDTKSELISQLISNAHVKQVNTPIDSELIGSFNASPNRKAESLAGHSIFDCDQLFISQNQETFGS